MTGDIMLAVNHVGKDYILGTVTGRTLRDALRERMGRQKETERHNRQFTALNDVSFQVRKGETVGIIGSNGAGKSTLLKLISRITAPTRGEICLDGRVTSMLEVGTGFHQELTGRENIYLNGSILGMTRKEIDEKIDSIIAFSECGDFIDTPVKRYSSGMYVKLAFSVASHLESEIMIMDEVLAVGDMKFQQKCLNKMKEIAEKEKRTILYVSHNMDTIRRLCSRCLVLDHGNLIFDGSAEEAARIYLGDRLRTAGSMDLGQYLRPGWLGRDEVRLTWAAYPDNPEGIMDKPELKLLLRWQQLRDMKHLGLRVELMQGDEAPFATAVYYDFCGGKAGETGEKTITVDLSRVKNGSYHTFYTIFAIDGYHNGVDIDCVRGLDLTVQRRENDMPLQWRADAWGNIQL